MTDDTDTVTRRHDLAAAILIIMVGTLALFAMIWGVLNAPAGDIAQRGVDASTSEVSQGATYIDQAWTYAPAFVLFAAALRLLSRAVFESRGGVR